MALRINSMRLIGYMLLGGAVSGLVGMGLALAILHSSNLGLVTWTLPGTVPVGGALGLLCSWRLDRPWVVIAGALAGFSFPLVWSAYVISVIGQFGEPDALTDYEQGLTLAVTMVISLLIGLLPLVARRPR